MLSMYSAGFRERLAQVKAGDRAGLETVIQFLEADPWSFGSGYTKEEILRALQRYELTEDQQYRLQNVILHMVDTRATREFRLYRKLARKVDSLRLRNGLLTRLRSEDEGIARRALWVLAYLPDVQLRPDDLKQARAILMREAANHTAGIFGWDSGWVSKLSRKYWDEEWEAELKALAKKNNTQGAAARYLLYYRGLRLMSQL